MESKQFAEQRQHPRVDNGISLKIFAADADFVTETRNLSCSGVYCKVDRYLEPMARLKVLLLVPDRKNDKMTIRKISCGGVVIRTENILNEESFNCAIFFSDISARDRKILADFVKQVIDQEKTSHA